MSIISKSENHPEVKSFLASLKQVRYSNQRFDESQQLACILAKIEGVTPGYSERNFKEAERLIKDYWTKYTEYVSAKMAGELG
jgi:hypothetical protein